MQEFDKKVFVLSLLVVLIGVCLHGFPSDDGLRHVGVAFSDFKSWGDVYPYSVFERFKDYDPWFGYDYCLKVIAAGLKLLPLPETAMKFLLVKGLSFIFLGLFFYLVLCRSGILAEIKDQNSFTLAYILLIVLLAQPSLRIMIIRPFAFGTFFLIYAVGQKGLAKGALSAAALMFFYPYLSWLYTIPVAFAHWLKGDKGFALGVISPTILFLGLQPSSFWGLQIALFSSDLVRQTMETKIDELHPTLNNLTFYIYVVFVLTLFPYFSQQVKKLNYSNLLILIYLLPALKYCRYFIDLTLPLLFISFGRDALNILIIPYGRIVSYWQLTIEMLWLKFWKKAAPVSSVSPCENNPRRFGSVNLKPYLAIIYLLVLALFVQRSYETFASLNAFQTQLSALPDRSLVLTDFNLQYKTLYTRPDLRLIPSCDLGSPLESIRKAYVGFFDKGDIGPLARKTGAAFLLENRKMYINPLDGGSLRLVNESKTLKVWSLVNEHGNFLKN